MVIPRCTTFAVAFVAALVARTGPQPRSVAPTALGFSTYLGGGADDFGARVVQDGNGNIYVAGHTRSLDFPVASPFQARNAGALDAFVCKLDPSGTSLLYSTYFGGSGSDSAQSIAVDGAGRACIVGLTSSSDLPLVAPIQVSNRGGIYDGFVAVLGPSGSVLAFSSYIGGTDSDAARAVAIGPAGDLHVVGDTESVDFPIVNAFQGTHTGTWQDAFVSRIDPWSPALVYSTYLGGTDSDRAFAVATDATGHAYVTGDTSSSNFPVLNAYQPSVFGSSSNAFVTKIAPAGSTLVYSTYLGGSAEDGADAIALDPTGRAYVVGHTLSTNFPTVNPLQLDQGGTDGFVARLGPGGNTLSFSTYLGGSGTDWCRAIALDSFGAMHVAGWTMSPNFPVLNPVQPSLAGVSDAFVTSFNAGGQLLLSTFFGGVSTDQAYGLSIDGARDLVFTGLTYSSDFPLLNPLQSALAGTQDAFVTRLAGAVGCPAITPSPRSLPRGTQGSPYSQTIGAYGGTAPYVYTVTLGSLPPGLSLSPAGTLSGTPSAAGTFSFTVRVTDATGCTGTRAYALVIN